MLKWLIAGLVIWLAWKLLAKPRKPARVSRVAPPGSDEQAANALLGVDIHSDAQAVRDAYRSRIAETHPDRGGSAELAQELNAARELLLRMRGE